MLYIEQDIADLDRKFRLNLINSITGIKPANLIGTRSKKQQDNVAIFSSVVHLGSNPAQLGIVMRPQTDGIKDTYANIMDTRFYTINHIAHSFIKKAHYTSAKLSKDTSEFDLMCLERNFIGDFYAPFVAESPVKIGLRLVEDIALPNGCIFLIGEVVLIALSDKAINAQGQLNLETNQTVGIAGLNDYYTLKKTASFHYVRENEIPEFTPSKK